MQFKNDDEMIIWQGGMRLKCGLTNHYCLIYIYRDLNKDCYSIRVHDTEINKMFHEKNISQANKIIKEDVFTNAVKYIELNLNSNDLNVMKCKKILNASSLSSENKHNQISESM